MNLSGSKKGQLHNYVTVIVFLFVFGFLTLIGMTVYLGMIQGYTDAGLYTGQIAESGEKFKSALLLHDWIIVLMMVAMIIGVGVTSFRLRTSAMFFILSIIFAPFLGFISYFFNHLFAQVASNDAVAAARLLFPNTLVICTNLHWVALVAFIVGSITLFAKKPSGEIVIPPTQ